MAATYYRDIEGFHDYASTRLKSIDIWKKMRFWEYALYGIFDTWQ
jgi:hypothetical protein